LASIFKKTKEVLYKIYQAKIEEGKFFDNNKIQMMTDYEKKSINVFTLSNVFQFCKDSCMVTLITNFKFKDSNPDFNVYHDTKNDKYYQIVDQWV
jgi:hypothetical protein